jgi:expansin (peptidoglycan-binding protein)
MRWPLFALVVGCSSGGGTNPGSDGAGTTTPLGMPEQGVATYYDATGAGNCGFDPSPNDLDVAAMDDPEWQGSAVCGACADVTGPNGKVTVRIVDRCPECEKGHLDLSKQAFAKIANVAAGKVPITWTLVPCNVSGPVAYLFKDGSSQWWTAIQVRNHRLPIRSLAWKKAGTWVDVQRADYNYFVEANGVGPAAFQVRITAWDGQTLEDMLPPVVAGQTVQGAAQFK